MFMNLLSNATAKAACKHILNGDMDAARAEAGQKFSVTPAQGRMLSGSLREAARRFNAPELATRSIFDI
jgi:hypothetical protein